MFCTFSLKILHKVFLVVMLIPPELRRVTSQDVWQTYQVLYHAQKYIIGRKPTSLFAISSSKIFLHIARQGDANHLYRFILYLWRHMLPPYCSVQNEMCILNLFPCKSLRNFLIQSLKWIGHWTKRERIILNYSKIKCVIMKVKNNYNRKFGVVKLFLVIKYQALLGVIPSELFNKSTGRMLNNMQRLDLIKCYIKTVGR